MFTPDSEQVLQVVVDGRVDSQQIVNLFYFKFSDPDTGLTGGSSTTFLTNFRASFRANMLAVFMDSYRVARYWLRSIRDVFQTLPPGLPAFWTAILDPDKLDILEGAVADVGAIATAGVRMLPTHTAARVLKPAFQRRVGFFSRSYNRYCPFRATDLDADPAKHDQWSAAFQVALGTATQTFHGAAVLDQVGGNGWRHAIWSATYYGRVAKPLGRSPAFGAELMATPIVEPFVGTQVSRRYHPAGGYEGR